MPFAYPKIRDDLTFHEEELEDRIVIYVKDPLRQHFYGLNELQIAMMRLLDGKRSFEEVADSLSNQYEMEVPVEKVRRFARYLEEKMLLDVTSYDVDSAYVRGMVKRSLRKRNLLWRSKPPAEPSQEWLLFQEGLAQIEKGNPSNAAGYFVAVLELNPQNERARAILETIHDAFFRAHRLQPHYMRMVHLFNPDRLLGAIDRRFGRLLFSVWGVLLLLGMLAGVMPIVMDVFSRPPEPLNVALLIALFLIVGIPEFFVHEMTHGLACKHYGGKVQSIGIMLFHNVIPGAYSDVSDMHQFPSKRHKVIVYLAGTLGQIPYICLLLLLYHFSAASHVLHKYVVLYLVLDAADALRNLLPLIEGSDGYFALANWLELPNLSADAEAYMRQQWRRRILGPGERDRTFNRREQRIFGLFGLAGTSFRVWFTVGAWLTVILPLAVTYLHGIGLVLALWMGYGLFRRAFVQPLATAARFCAQNFRKVFTARRVALVAGCAVAAIAVMATPFPLLVDGRMEIRPQQRVVVNAQEDGLVDRMVVKEGEHVRAGQLLCVLHNDELTHARDTLAQQIAESRLRLEVLRKGARAEEIAVATTRARAGKVAEELAGAEEERAAALSKEHVRADVAAAQAQMAATHAADQAEQALAALKLLRAGARPEDLAQAETLLTKLEVRLQELDQRLSKLTIVSPVDGVVVGKQLQDRQRSLKRGQALCEIHDLSSVFAEVRLPQSEPLKQLATGQPVTLAADGDPRRLIQTQVEKIQPVTQGPDAFIVVETAPFANPRWPTGLSGHGRVYGPRRSLAYLMFGVPLLQAFDYKAWRFWG